MTPPKPIAIFDIFRQCDNFLREQHSWGAFPGRLPVRAAHRYDQNNRNWGVEVVKQGALACRAHATTYGLIDPIAFLAQVNNMQKDGTGISLMAYAELILDMADYCEMRDSPWLLPWHPVAQYVAAYGPATPYLGVPFATRVYDAIEDLAHALRHVGGRSLQVIDIPDADHLTTETAQAEAVRYLHNMDCWHPAQRGGDLQPMYGKYNPSQMPWPGALLIGGGYRNERTGWREDVAALRVVSVYHGQYPEYRNAHDHTDFVDTVQAGTSTTSKLRIEAGYLKTAARALDLRAR